MSRLPFEYSKAQQTVRPASAAKLFVVGTALLAILTLVDMFFR